VQNRRAGAVVGLVLVAAVALVAALGGCGDSDSDTTATQSTTSSKSTGESDGKSTTTTTSTEAEPKVATIVIEGGQPEGGVQELEFSEGDDIRFVVESDTADEVHFHGYDVGKDVEAGGKVEFDVPATIPGIFEVELESTATQIAEITVD
jgi:hypothetical protein